MQYTNDPFTMNCFSVRNSADFAINFPQLAEMQHWLSTKLEEKSAKLIRFPNWFHSNCFFYSLQLYLSWSKAMISTQPCSPSSHGYRMSMCINRWHNVNLFCNDVWLILNLITNPFWYRCTWLALNDYEKVFTRITNHWMRIKSV